VRTVPAPVDNRDEPLQMQVALLDYNDYIGRIGIGRIFRGTMRNGEQVALMKLDGSVKHFRVTKMFGFMGLKRVEIEEAYAGDLVAVSGMGDILVGETICPVEAPDPLPPLRIDEPTLKMTFLVNNSPFAGREGKFVTARKIEERLKLELQTDVSLRVEPTDSPDAWIVSGRGELHLAILIETMRREGFELQVSKPEVIEKEIDGKICEPFERVVIDVPEEYSGQVIESLGRRKGNLLDMRHAGNGQVRLVYSVPSRGLIGYQSELMSMTRGYAIYNHSFEEYRPKLPFEIGRRERGVLVALETGTASTYGILQLEDRGTIFVEPGTEVYEGMIVGEHNRENDLTVNICKTKHATNIRSATKEQTQIMKKPRIFTLEEALQYLDDDEYCEVTPKSIRLRKKILNKSEREKLAKKRKM
ncbi:MAG: translational GTPase TypA, partial [Bacillaceae bacterium]|nr:translational GTPase TypA [Bacillaceae bacterium]